MTSVALVTALLVAAVTLLHYEALQGIHRRLGRLAMPARPKVLVVMAGCFLAHVAAIALYAEGYYALLAVPPPAPLHQALDALATAAAALRREMR